MPDGDTSDLPLVGVRSFGWRDDGVLTCACYEFGAWAPGTNTAVCRRMDGTATGGAPHPRGHEACGGNCGFNAFDRLEDAASYWAEHFRGIEPVMAAVVGWGDVELHRSGWRAQHARVVAVARDDRSRSPAALAAARYGVPLVDRSDLERVALEHGRPARAQERPGRRDAARYAAGVARALLGGPRSTALILPGLLAPLTFALAGLTPSLPMLVACMVAGLVACATLAGNLFLVSGQWPLCRKTTRRAAVAIILAAGAVLAAVSAGFAGHAP